MSIDRREDAGEFYPGGKVISTRPVATGGDVKRSDFAGLDVKTNTIPDLRDAVRELGRRLGATVVTALSACVAVAATVQTVPVNDLDFDANPSIVTNVTFEGLAQEGELESIRVEIASNRVAIASNVYTKAETDALIDSATPEDYDVVRAQVGTNAADVAALGRSLSNDFARVGAVLPVGEYYPYDASYSITNTVWFDEDVSLNYGAMFFEELWYLPRWEYSTNEWAYKMGVDREVQIGYGWEGEDGGSKQSFVQFGSIVDSWEQGAPDVVSRLYPDGSDVMTSNRVAAAISTLSDSISTLSNTTSTVSSGLAALADEARPAINGYARLYSFVTSSTNANFVVTNYQLTAEAEAARTHFDPSDPDLDFSIVPPSLRLEDASSGTNRVVVDTRDWVVWYYAQKIGGAIAEAVSTAVDTCRAWCSFTATGLENPIPDTLVIDVPNIWLMAGKTFEKHVAGSNACWVIRSNGVTMPISDNAQSAGGFLELTDAFGTPYIRFNKTENYFVDPVADGISYDSELGEWRILYSTTNCPAGGANAAIVGSTTYPGKAVLKAEDDPDCPATITWTGSANNWVMHAVPKPIDGAVPKSMFFGAVVEVQGQDYIEYLRPMSIPHLLVDGVKIAPVVPASHPTGTTITWKVVE